MFKYLEYVKSVFSSCGDNLIRELLLNEISLYERYWSLYCNDQHLNLLHNHKVTMYNKHTFHLPTKESVEISWDIEPIYEYAISNESSLSMSLEQFEHLLQIDINESLEEFNIIKQTVKSIYQHTYDAILIINFKPTNSFLFLDGRHRFIEHQKFNPTKNINAYIIDDEKCIDCILKKNELVSYIILHNIKEISDYITFQSNYINLFNLEHYLK